jgi:glycosyltransferase involved in cell wall biosynthesis
MNILILNWRDIKNPKSGGAEVLTHEIAKRWVKLGHKVTIFSSYFDRAKKEETLEGVKIVRRGHPDARFLLSSVHFLGYKYYKENEENIDAVVDEVHGLPFFSNLYVKKKKIVLICEVAGKLWIKMLGPFFGLLGRTIENIFLHFMYRNIPYLTISDSTKDELIENGVDPKNITVLPMGITVPQNLKKVKKEESPTIIFVGRLAKSKGIEDIIKALKSVSAVMPKVRLWVVGDGEKEYVKYIKRIAGRLELSNRITFFGFISQEKKFDLMARAHILVAPSIKEGWGLIVPEAAYVGTSSIVYNSSGLRDVLKGSDYKIITKSNNSEALAEEITKFISKGEYDIKKKFSNNYSWDKTADVALRILENA